MPSLKKITVKESVLALRKLKKSLSFSKQKRIQMLLVIKEDTRGDVSKRKLAKKLFVNHNSITEWKKLYETKGIEGLLEDGRIGFKTSVISATTHKKIEEKLNNNQNGINGYKELQNWVKDELLDEIKYTTLLQYTQRNFGVKLKVCRKSHIKKNPLEVEIFKKILV